MFKGVLLHNLCVTGADKAKGQRPVIGFATLF